MTLVALSAAYGAGGSVIGPALAERLGVPFLDRAIPLAVADRLAVPVEGQSYCCARIPAPSGSGSTGRPSAASGSPCGSTPASTASAPNGPGHSFDRTHQAYMRQFYDVDIRDAGLYHLVLDSTSIEFDACVEVIARTAHAFAATAAEASGGGPGR